jgi:hypothetical protein
MLQTRANYIICSSVFVVLRRIVTKPNTYFPFYHPGVTIFEVHEYNWALKFIAVVSVKACVTLGFVCILSDHLTTNKILRQLRT